MKNRERSAQRSQPLDLLRAWAIAWVFLFHYLNSSEATWLRGLGPFGWAGVDLFFVLSGFLIGSQLLKPISTNASFSFRKFYIRRFFRTLPNYWVVLAIYFFIPALSERSGLPPLWKFLTFTQNLGLDHKNYGAFSHAWSLCVEEYFYFFLPAIVWIFAKIGTPARTVGALISVLVFGLICRGLIWTHYVAPALADGSHKPLYSFFNEMIYYPTYNRLDGLLVGVTIAIIYRLRPTLWHHACQIGDHLLIVGIAALSLGLFISIDKYSFANSVFTYPLISIGFGCFIVAGLAPNSIFSRIRVPGATWVATLAFSFYLTHKQVIHFILVRAPNWGLAQDGASALFLSLTASVATSVTLYLLVERPFLLLRERITESVLMKSFENAGNDLGVKQLLASLFKIVVSDGITLRISGAGNTNGEEGFFHPSPRAIEIFPGQARGWVDAQNADSLAQASVNPLTEVLVLAHEYGHSISHKNNQRTTCYEAAVLTPVADWPNLSLDDKNAILDEEQLAWQHAKTTLDGLEFEHWDAFNSKRKDAVRAYYSRLALAPHDLARFS